MALENTTPETNTPPLEQDFAVWQERLDRLEQESTGLTETGQFPDWWYDEPNPVPTLRHSLQEETSDPTNLSRYYELYRKDKELTATIRGRAMFGHPLTGVAETFGTERMSQAFQAEAADGPLHAAVLDALKSAQGPLGLLTHELSMLRVAYGYQTATELLGLGGDEYSDEVGSLLRNSQPIRWMRYIDQEREEGATWPETQEATRKWMTQAIQAVSGMEADEAAEYVHTASRRGYDELILSVIQKFDHFGTDRIRAISQATGIHGLEGYTIEQLERMETFATDPQKAAKQLAEHDVTVVLINRVGDHSGVLQDVADTWDDDKERTLFFEVNNLMDIMRRGAALEKADIHPSTLVLAAHSAPGQFMVSDDREPGAKRRSIATVAGRRLVEIANADSELRPGDRAYAMHGMKGVSRLVESYMQPSRGIDDPVTDAGRKKIVFQACNAATEGPVVDKDEQGEKVELGMDSVISRLGNDLIESGVTSNVDIYGAAETIQMHRTEHGAGFSGSPEDLGRDRPPVNATRVRVQSGKLEKDEVAEIAMRKAA